MMTNKDFWITNISDRNVSLSDLNISIPAWSSVNLLDTRHYSFTNEQVIKSANAGSLFKKRDKIVVRKIAPKVCDNKQLINLTVNTMFPSKIKSIYEIKIKEYDELKIDDLQDGLGEIDADKKIGI